MVVVEVVVVVVFVVGVGVGNEVGVEVGVEVIMVDKEAWLLERTEYVTSTDMAIVLGHAPKWFSQDRAGLIAEKRAKKPADFTPSRRMLWGSYSEYENIHTFAYLLGIPRIGVVAENSFHKLPEERVAATTDGIIGYPQNPIKKGYTSNDANLQAVHDALTWMGGDKAPWGLVEAKQSDGWKSQVEAWDLAPPIYYVDQVQTALWVTGEPWAVIFCRLGVADLRAHVIMPDMDWRATASSAVKAFWEEVDSEQR